MKFFGVCPGRCVSSFSSLPTSFPFFFFVLFYYFFVFILPFGQRFLGAPLPFAAVWSVLIFDACKTLYLYPAFSVNASS